MMKKILVIDDEPQILFMVSSRLTANGYVVVTALSGVEGLKKAKEEPPDLIFLDYVMPEMDGAEVLARLKEDPAMRQIPVVMFTADIQRVNTREFQSRGAADCLYKPFFPEEILAKVREALEKT